MPDRLRYCYRSFMTRAENVLQDPDEVVKFDEAEVSLEVLFCRTRCITRASHSMPDHSLPKASLIEPI